MFDVDERVVSHAQTTQLFALANVLGDFFAVVRVEYELNQVLILVEVGGQIALGERVARQVERLERGELAESARKRLQVVKAQVEALEVFDARDAVYDVGVFDEVKGRKAVGERGRHVAFEVIAYARYGPQFALEQAAL